MTDDLHSEAVERSAFVGVFLVIRDLVLAMVSRGVSLKYRWDPESRQHAFEFSVHRDTPEEGGPYYDPQGDGYSHRPPLEHTDPYDHRYYR